MKVVLLLTILFMITSCGHTTYDHGVPNLVQVRSNVWRSGQPTAEGWSYLRSLFGMHSVHVIKLNFADEGSDDPARLVGFDVHTLSIDPRTNPDNIIHATAEIFEKPAADVWDEIVRQISFIPTEDTGDVWLVHCVNGHDRTGLTTGYIRVLIDKWHKSKAWQEMLDRGYHPELIGLDRQWMLLKE